jgi:hypothetical protein
VLAAQADRSGRRRSTMIDKADQFEPCFVPLLKTD